MSQRFDYERRKGKFHVFDRKGEGGASQPLARCAEVWVAELLVATLRDRENDLKWGTRNYQTGTYSDLAS